MSRILVPSSGADDWRRLLAKPELHWELGYSARTLANSWEAANGLPAEVEQILCAALGPVELLFAVPEHKTPLPGGRRASQSDIFLLAGHSEGLLACTIEGKVDESFDVSVAEWSVAMSPGKKERLEHLCMLLGLENCPGDVHYQLLHRTAAAIIEAKRFGTKHAAMIVHSFSPENRWFDAYERFCALFKIAPKATSPTLVDLPNGTQLVLGWACGEQRFRLM